MESLGYYYLKSDTVGPGQAEEFSVKFEMPKNLEGLKLLFGGENFSAMVNLN